MPTSAWVAVLFYAIQIYCDFSGYTDMAIATRAVARLRAPGQFPISLISPRTSPSSGSAGTSACRAGCAIISSISLGGSRGPRWFAYRNIMITMVLGGLMAWCGLDVRDFRGACTGWRWSFTTSGSAGRERFSANSQSAMWWIACPLTFYWVCITLIFFRSGDLHRAGTALRSFVLFSSNGVEQLGAWKLLVVVVARRSSIG